MKRLTRWIVAPVFHGFESRPSPQGGITMEQNITSTSGRGKVHKLIRADTYTHRVLKENEGHPDYGIHAPWCDRTHNIDEEIGEDFFLKWGRTRQPITCKTCLQAYWPDGSKRFLLALIGGIKKKPIVHPFSTEIYAYNETLVIRQDDGKCWQLAAGDYLGEIPKEELVFVKRATLSN